MERKFLSLIFRCFWEKIWLEQLVIFFVDDSVSVEFKSPSPILHSTLSRWWRLNENTSWINNVNQPIKSITKDWMGWLIIGEHQVTKQYCLHWAESVVRTFFQSWNAHHSMIQQFVNSNNFLWKTWKFIKKTHKENSSHNSALAFFSLLKSQTTERPQRNPRKQAPHLIFACE